MDVINLAMMKTIAQSANPLSISGNTIDITWDGVTNDFDLDGFMHFSDKTPSLDDIIGSTVTFTYGGETYDRTVYPYGAEYLKIALEENPFPVLMASGNESQFAILAYISVSEDRPLEILNGFYQDVDTGDCIIKAGLYSCGKDVEGEAWVSSIKKSPKVTAKEQYQPFFDELKKSSSASSGVGVLHISFDELGLDFVSETKVTSVEISDELYEKIKNAYNSHSLVWVSATTKAGTPAIHMLMDQMIASPEDNSYSFYTSGNPVLIVHSDGGKNILEAK